MRRTRSTRRALLVAVCLSPLIALAAWQAYPFRSNSFDTVSVSRGSIESSVSALGTLQPRRYVDVGAQASGQIRKLHVEAGDDVTEGQLLVEIDPSTQQAKVDAGRYSIEMLKAQLAEQRAQYTLARQQYQRQQRLAAGGATRTEDVQSAQAQMLATQARIEMYQAQIRQAQASLRSDEAELGYTRIYAPMSGTVVAVDAREGQTLNAQQQTPLILRIAKLSPMTVWAQVSKPTSAGSSPACRPTSRPSAAKADAGPARSGRSSRCRPSRWTRATRAAAAPPAAAAGRAAAAGWCCIPCWSTWTTATTN